MDRDDSERVGGKKIKTKIYLSVKTTYVCVCVCAEKRQQ